MIQVLSSVSTSSLPWFCLFLWLSNTLSCQAWLSTALWVVLTAFLLRAFQLLSPLYCLSLGPFCGGWSFKSLGKLISLSPVWTCLDIWDGTIFWHKTTLTGQALFPLPMSRCSPLTSSCFWVRCLACSIGASKVAVSHSTKHGGLLMGNFF